uniref:Uncharacterized protein n=1 Tax=Arundo donax TaxID=35708 RepID=A0A0A9AIR9_ARUDO
MKDRTMRQISGTEEENGATYGKLGIASSGSRQNAVTFMLYSYSFFITICSYESLVRMSSICFRHSRRSNWWYLSLVFSRTSINCAIR